MIGVTPVTFIIIAVTVIISLRAFKDVTMKYKWVFYPYKVNREKQYYRIFTHIFIHGDSMHLFFNMFVLYSFGMMMESTLGNYFGQVGIGSAHFLLLYILGGIAACIWPYLRNVENQDYMSLGASGAVSAVVFASILWMPDGGIYLFLIPFRIPAWIFGILFLAFEFYMGKQNRGRIAHDAHFGGALFGIAYILFINFDKGSAFINYILS